MSSIPELKRQIDYLSENGLEINLTIDFIGENVVGFDKKNATQKLRDQTCRAFRDAWSPLREDEILKHSKNIEVAPDEKHADQIIVTVLAASHEELTVVCQAVKNNSLKRALRRHINYNVMADNKGGGAVDWQIFTAMNNANLNMVVDYQERRKKKITVDPKPSFYESDDIRGVEEDSGQVLNISGGGDSMISSDKRQSSSSGYSSSSSAAAGKQVLSVDMKTSKLAKMMFSFTKSKRMSWFDLYKVMSSAIGRGIDLTILRSPEGFNLLHAIVESQREELLYAIFFLGLWAPMRSQLVSFDTADYPGMTSRAIVEKYCNKKEGVLFASVYDELDDRERGSRTLQKACRLGSRPLVEHLINERRYKTSMLKSYKDREGSSLWHWAMMGRSMEVIDYLLGLKLDPTQPNSRQETPLHIACRVGFTAGAKILVEKFKMRLDAKDNNKVTPGHYIGQNGDQELFQAVWSKENVSQELLNILLQQGAHRGHSAFVAHLIDKHGADIKSMDSRKCTPLLLAADGGHSGTLKVLREHGAPLLSQTLRKTNILHILIEKEKVKTIRWVIQWARDEGVLAVLLAQRDLYIGEKYVSLIRGKDQGKRAWHEVEIDRKKYSLFLKKVKRGRVDVQEYGDIILSGWGIAPSPADLTKIHQIFETREKEGTQPLDMSPLHAAVMRNHLKIAEILLEAGADPNQKDYKGMSPGHIAGMQGNLPMMPLLSKFSAILSHSQDNDGDTPLEVAKMNENDEVANYLKADDHKPIMGQFVETVRHTTSLLEADRLNSLRNNGKDIRKLIVDTLRDFEVSIHGALKDLGSSPIMDETIVPRERLELVSTMTDMYPE